MPKSRKPKWIDHTPDEPEAVEYRLDMYDENEPVQGIVLSRGEFIALKGELAKRRGIAANAGKPAA